MTRNPIVPVLASAGLMVALAAVGSRAQAPHGGMMMAASPITKAVAVLHPTKSSKVEGKVTFTQTPDGIKVEAHIHNLPKGAHGFHIHEFGDTSSDEGMSTGGHFNPTGAEHGAPTGEKRHVGDLGNIVADEDGHAKLELVDHMIAFSGSHSIIGRGVVVHEKADDYGQPTGNAGGRLAVGTIGIAKAAAPAKEKAK